MEPITLDWAAEKLQARILGTAGPSATSVCTDSREVTPGALFFALQGEQSDGHRYVADAFKNGAVAAVVSREIEGVTGPLLLVPDTLQALGDLAMHYRRQFDIPVVGITGSVGKTSTKEMTAAVLRTRYNTLASAKNFNTEIGVPLTLFQLDKTHEAAVIEMGMRGLGQIDRLAEIAEPTIGVITNIGYTHMELLGSQQNIAQAKSELLARLPEDGIAILPEDSPFFDYLRSRIPAGCRLITFSSPKAPTADVVVKSISINSRKEPFLLKTKDEQQTFFPVVNGQEYPVRMSVVGTHHGSNAAAALATALALDIGIQQAIQALEQWEGAEGRMTVRQTASGITVLDDCYNASVESMGAAIATLFSITLGRPAIAVLGDMRELGDFGPEAHRQIGQAVGMLPAALRLVTVGDLALGIERAALREREYNTGRSHLEIYHYDTSEEAAAHINEIVKPGDTVLVKGSRAMQMEKIVAALTGERSTNGHG